MAQWIEHQLPELRIGGSSPPGDTILQKRRIMSTKKNPHLIILESLYGLVKKYKDDPDTLKRLSLIAWALEFDLDLDEYTYHYVSELADMLVSNPSEKNEYYVSSIEAKINELRKST
jgi:hypothetical protein